MTMGRQPGSDRRSSVVDRLRDEQAQLRAQGVAALALVGSIARGDDSRSSDVDVLIDIQPGRPFSLLDLSGVRLLVGDILGREADVLVRDDLPAHIRQRVEEDAVSIF